MASLPHKNTSMFLFVCITFCPWWLETRKQATDQLWGSTWSERANPFFGPQLFSRKLCLIFNTTELPSGASSNLFACVDLGWMGMQRSLLTFGYSNHLTRFSVIMLSHKLRFHSILMARTEIELFSGSHHIIPSKIQIFNWGPSV
jgi:hypothetical protein